MYLLLTSLASVVLSSCIPFMGSYSRNSQGRGVVGVLHLSSQPGRGEMAIADICVVFVRSV